MTSFENVTSLTEFLQTANNMTDGWLTSAFIVGFAIVVYMAAQGFGKTRALFASSFLSMLLAVLMNALGLVGSEYLIITGIAVAVSGLVAAFYK